MKRPQFYVEVRFDSGRRQWTTYDWFARLRGAVSLAECLVQLKNADGNRPFPHVRLRHRGHTLALWKNGWVVR